MTSPCEKFIALPELLASLVPFLSKTDLIRLASTNRIVFQNCVLLLWHSLDLQQPSSSARLLDSPEALQELGNNIDLVRALSWGTKFSEYYFQVLWVYLTSNTTQRPFTHQSILTDALSHENWGAVRRSLAAPSVTSLPPLLALARFEICMSQIPYAEQRRRATPPNYATLPNYTHARHHHQNLWLARLNFETLTHLKYTGLQLQSARVVRDLCRTISQLVHLRTLYLGTQRYLIYCIEKSQMLATIFFSCPSSLVELSLERMRGVSGSTLPSLDPGVGDWDYDQGPLVLRGTPLLRLKRLGLPRLSSNLVLAHVLQSFLEHCPAVEVLELRFADGSFVGLSPLFESLGQLSPLISDLSFPGGCPEEFLRRALQNLTPRRLKVLSSDWYLPNLRPGEMDAAPTPQFSTLQWIELIDCNFVQRGFIQTVLTTCTGLEVFRVTGRRGGGQNCLLMKDATDSEWACGRIRHLEIGILMANPQYLNDPSCATWTKNDYSHWELLGQLYAQIGLLTQLEVLELRAISWKGMPIGLGVEDVVRGKKAGHLEMLSELTRLREIRGMYPWTQGDDQARIGEREAEWFASNLPRLRSMTFTLLNDSEGYRVLRARRPWLKLRVV